MFKSISTFFGKYNLNFIIPFIMGVLVALVLMFSQVHIGLPRLRFSVLTLLTLSIGSVLLYITLLNQQRKLQKKIM